MTYADIRNRELEHIKDALKDDREFKKRINKLYNDSSQDIQRLIDADIQRFADSQGVSMTEARKMISKTDVEAFQSTAKKYVEEKNFSPQANRELRKYNVTMRTNQLELLQARINLETIALAEAEGKATTQRITEALMAEYTRQAGILGESVPSQSMLQRIAKSVTLADVNGATFSDRIWANQNELRDSINQTIQRSLLRGNHPRNSAAEIKRNIRDDVRNKRHAANRIAVTETARAQSIAMSEALNDSDFDEYVYIAETTACEVCAALDDKVFKVKDMQIGINASPMHPHCRCATSAHVSDGEEETPQTTDTAPYEFMDLSSADYIENEERVKAVIERSKAAVDSYKEETGIDVLELYKNKQFHDKSNPYDDEHAKFTKYMMQRTGYDGLPQKLDDTSGLHNLYRGVSDTPDGSMTSVDMVNNFMNGQVDISGGLQSASGRGFYFGEHESTAESYSEEGENGAIIEAFLTKDTKLLNSDVFRKDKAYLKSIPDTLGDDSDYYNLVSGGNWMMDKNYELFAMMHGYDGINMGNGLYMIINRSSLGVKK